MTLIEHSLIRTPDGLDLPMRRWRAGASQSARGAALLLHGASASSETFVTPDGGLAAFLHRQGWEVWLLDWRGSDNVAERYSDTAVFSFDRVAECDIPSALAHVRKVSRCEHVAVLGHCVGAACLSIAIARGCLSTFGVKDYVLTTIGLFFCPPIESFLKAEDSILERVRAGAPECRVIDPRRGTEWPPELQRAFEAWPKSWLPAGESRADQAFRRASFMFGAPYERRNVPDPVHEQLGRLFGRMNLELYIHAGQCVRRGVAAPFGAPEVDASVARSMSYCDATHFEDTRVTLLTGKSNQLWSRESVDRMYEWLKNETSGAHQKHVLPGYGHQDLFWGHDAEHDVYPLIAAGLERATRVPLREAPSVPRASAPPPALGRPRRPVVKPERRRA
jgi:cholesterol oxidase